MDPDHPVERSKSPRGSTFTGQVAQDQARQHVGDNYNSYSSTFIGYGGSLISGPWSHKTHNKELLLAAANGATQRVRMLLSKGADIDFKESREAHRGWTALHYAASVGFKAIVNILIDAGCELNTIGDDRLTPLQLSLMAGQWEVAKNLAQADGIRNPPGPKGRTTLHVAARSGCDKVVHGLLNANCDPNPCDDDDRTPLQHAAELGHIAVVQTLLGSPRIRDRPTRDGHTALSEAVEHEHTDVVQKLVDSQVHGVCDVNALYEYDCPHLTLAVRNRSLEVARILLLAPQIMKDGIDVFGDTALHTAAHQGNYEMVVLLINHGSNLNIQGKEGKTPLHVAVEKQYENVTKLLLGANAKLEIEDDAGRTPAHIAARGSCSSILGMLLDHKASLCIRTSQGMTPLHLACRADRPENVTMLLNAGANIKERDNEGRTPLHRAVVALAIDVVKLLLRAGASIAVQDTSGNTALHYAAIQMRPEELSVLLEKAGLENINVQNNEGDTALHIVACAGEYTKTKQLVEAGAKILIKNNLALTPLEAVQQYSLADEPIVQYLHEKQEERSLSHDDQQQNTTESGS